jgi:hypothetical protein
MAAQIINFHIYDTQKAFFGHLRVDARSMLSAILEGDHHLSISQQSPIRLSMLS